MAKPDKQAIAALIAASPGASEGEIIAALQEEIRSNKKAASANTGRGIVPKVKAADQAAVKVWLTDGNTDGNVSAETQELANAIVAGDFDAIALNVWQLAKASLKAFEPQIPQLPPTPQV